jgi:phosphoesterase RecJ-like protein
MSIPFATVTCNQPVVATGEVIYELAKQLDWPLAVSAKNMISTAIMSDSLGLSTPATSARSIHIIGELVEGGVSLSKLEYARRQLMRKSPELTHYKGELLQRVEYSANDRIASVSISWSEIEKYSPHYNPSMLVLEDMRMTANTEIAIAFKIYQTGRVTAKIRCNQDAPIANKLAEKFGGGGHSYASGFKVQDGRPFNEIRSECLGYATELLDNIEREPDHETIQYTVA